jgi:integrase
MASLRKIPGRKVWIACFTDLAGRRRQRSTGTRIRQEALKIAHGYEEAARRKRTARQIRQVIGKLHEELTGEDLPTVTVTAFIDEWLGQKEGTASPATLVFYRKAVKKFLAFLGAAATCEISEITRDHLIRFRNHEAKTLAPNTVNHDLKCLKSIFKAARRDSVLLEDPTEFVETVRLDNEKERRPFTLPEMQAVISAANEEWRSMVRFGLYTGQRLADIAMLTWSNIDLARGQLRLQTRKTGRRLLLPLPLPLRRHLELLAAQLDGSTPLHPGAYAIVSREGRSGSLSNQFSDILAQAGIRAKKSHNAKKGGEGRSSRREQNQLSFHSLRRTATTLLHEAGIPAAVAQELIGHDSEDVHRLYVNVGWEAMEQAARVMPDLG